MEARWEMGQPVEKDGWANDWWSCGWSIKVYKECSEIIRERVSIGLITPHKHKQTLHTLTQERDRERARKTERERLSRSLRIIKQTESLMMKFWRSGVTRGTLQGSQPFPWRVFCSLYLPHNITFPPLCSPGGRWVGELCYIPVYLLMTSSRQFCTW